MQCGTDLRVKHSCLKRLNAKKCAVTGLELELAEIHGHHKIPVEKGSTDVYANLVIVHKNVHSLIEHRFMSGVRREKIRR